MQINKSSLTPEQKRLVELMQRINFGRITNLAVKDGAPEFSRETAIEREVKLNVRETSRCINGPRTESEYGDFVLKQEVVTLLEQLSQIDTGTVRQLDIKHGLPFLMRIEERVG